MAIPSFVPYKPNLYLRFHFRSALLFAVLLTYHAILYNNSLGGIYHSACLLALLPRKYPLI